MTDRRARGADHLRYVAVALLLVEGGIHLQQVQGPLASVPTINTLFVLNAVGAAGIALVLAGARQRVAVLAALAGIGLTVGALASLAITRSDTLFEYSEPSLRAAVALSAGVELAAVIALAAFVLARIPVAQAGAAR